MTALPTTTGEFMSVPAYSKDAPFTDPVVRCDSCNKLVLRTTAQKHGFCNHCGNRKVRQINMMSMDELAEVKTWNIDPIWIALFEVVNE